MAATRSVRFLATNLRPLLVALVYYWNNNKYMSDQQFRLKTRSRFSDMTSSKEETSTRFKSSRLVASTSYTIPIMDPYTPARRAKKNLTLSAKEYTKVRSWTWRIGSSYWTAVDHWDHRFCQTEPPTTRWHWRGALLQSQKFKSWTILYRRNIICARTFKLTRQLCPSTIQRKRKSDQTGHSRWDIYRNTGGYDPRRSTLHIDGTPLRYWTNSHLTRKKGIEGTYITHHPDYSPEDDDPLLGIRFVASPSLDASLRDLVERIIPLGMYYTAITSFIELRSHLEFGLVNHALCAAIRDMLKVSILLCSHLYTPFNHCIIGLPDPPLTTRTCIQHLTYIYSPKALVLRPPNSSHPLSYLPPRSWTHQWSQQLEFSLWFRAISISFGCRGRSEERSAWIGRCEAQSCHVWDQSWWGCIFLSRYSSQRRGSAHNYLWAYAASLWRSNCSPAVLDALAGGRCAVCGHGEGVD